MCVNIKTKSVRHIVKIALNVLLKLTKNRCLSYKEWHLAGWIQVNIALKMETQSHGYEYKINIHKILLSQIKFRGLNVNWEPGSAKFWLEN